MLNLLGRLAEFTFYRALVMAADAVSRLPRDMEPDVLRVYRENIALKAQVEALLHLQALERKKNKPRVPLRVRAAQVFAFLLTQGDDNFQRYFLTASTATIKRWLTRFRTGKQRDAKHAGGRPETHEEIVRLIVLMKQENPAWGCKRIRQELRKIGIKLSKETVRNILRTNGYPVPPVGKSRGQAFVADAKEALWAMDFFAVRTARGAWAQVLLVMDIYTRELLMLKVHDGWDVDSLWVTAAVRRLFFETGRKPLAIVNDAGAMFKDQFERLLRVEGVEQKIGAISLSHSNVYAERHTLANIGAQPVDQVGVVGPVAGPEQHAVHGVRAAAEVVVLPRSREVVQELQPIVALCVTPLLAPERVRLEPVEWAHGTSWVWDWCDVAAAGCQRVLLCPPLAVEGGCNLSSVNAHFWRFGGIDLHGSALSTRALGSCRMGTCAGEPSHSRRSRHPMG